MLYKLRIVFVPFIVGLVSLDQGREYCPPDYYRFWPETKPSAMDFKFISNDNANHRGPIYKLDVVSPGGIMFEPRVGYRMTLSTTEEVSLINRFLISIISTKTNENPGKLKSLSDKSEPLSTDCWTYLRERPVSSSGEYVGFAVVPFEWETPDKGCIEIRVQVLDSGESLFQYDDDPHEGLKKTFCIRNPLTKDSKYKGAIKKEHLGGKRYCCKRGKRSKSCVLTGDSETFYKAHSKYGMSFEACSYSYTQCCFSVSKRKTSTVLSK